MAELRAPALPDEIYLRIAKHLAVCCEDRELRSLRLISRIFTEVIDARFIEVYYANHVCPATLTGLRNPGFMFQDLTLAPFIKTLAIVENTASTVSGIFGYLDSIQNILQSKSDAGDRMTLIVRLNGAVTSQQITFLCFTLLSIYGWPMNSPNNPVENFEFDMNIPFGILSQRGTVLHNNIDPGLVSRSALLFSKLLSPGGLDHLDLLLRLRGNVHGTAMTMTFRYTKANRRLECLAPLAIDQHRGLLSLSGIRFYRDQLAELDIRNCYVHYFWLEPFIHYNRMSLRSVVLENVKMPDIQDGFDELKTDLLECSGLQYIRLKMLHDRVSSQTVFEKEIEMHEDGAPGRIHDFIAATDFRMPATPPGFLIT